MVISDIMGHVGVMLWHLKGHQGDLVVRPAWLLHESRMTWEGQNLRHFLKTPFGDPNGATWSRMVPKWYQQLSKKWHVGKHENINSGLYLPHFGHIDPSKSLPKLMRKSDPTKADPKYTNTRYPFFPDLVKNGFTFWCGSQNGPKRRQGTPKWTKKT